jgi:diaminopimelate decarboxylase
MSYLRRFTNSFQEFETPFYFYDLEVLKQTLETINQLIFNHPYHVHYALKANVNTRLLGIIKNAGFGADCVSGNEVKRALEVGFDKEKIVFAGVGKTDREINIGLDNDIYSFNVESYQELQVLNQLAGEKGKKARFSLRINPNVDPETHKYITTGTRENKFGITIGELKAIIPDIHSLKNVEFMGLHFHIGSQITKNSKFIQLCERINELQNHLLENGFNPPDVNVGGGLGVNYNEPDSELIPDFEAYFDVFKTYLKPLEGQQVHFELGRSVIAQCGSLISRVLYTKPSDGKSFLILDAGMTELIRPALYQAYHHVENISSVESEENYDVVGPICETSDAFARDIKLPASKRNDLIAIRSAGAYAEVMSSRYNLRDVAPSHFSDELV